MKSPAAILVSFALLATASQARAQWLFDATRAEMAGNADWVIDADLHNLRVSSAADGSGTVGTGGTDSNPQRVPTASYTGITGSTAETYWTGALSTWGVGLVQRGIATGKSGYAAVESLPYNGQITYGNAGNAQDLSNYKVYAVVEPNILFTASERAAILSFVQNGGSLFMVADHGSSDRNNDGNDSVDAWNDAQFKSAFGITVNGDTVTPASPSFDALASDPIIHGQAGNISQFSYSSGSTLTISTAANASVKAAVWSTSTHSNSNAMVAYGTYGLGRFVMVGDSSPFDDGTGDSGDTLFDGWNTGQNGSLILNASYYLQGIAVPEPSALALVLLGVLALFYRRRA